ncbi:hypothetical protein [Eubacterium oxidoreducens]|uniref:Uncharacterized protein n=1 Tax=Eubacterium oxidoreducens TaxID=1732 RepID=A0A1G6BT85_EUBOX|nr:hypothetical protein [Eubacterium oxidoreducens]SDB23833.1 hypothetical protein SAMN02910417_01788 [Eubacterium oxidoreducens]
MKSTKKLLALALAAAVVVSVAPQVSAQAATVKAKGYTISKKAGTYNKTITIKLKAKKGYKVYYTTGSTLKTGKVVKSTKTKTITIKKTTKLKVYAVKSSTKITNKKLKTKKVKKATKTYIYTIKKTSSSSNSSTSNNTTNNNSSTNTTPVTTTAYKYVTMNVPYTDFYAAYNPTDTAVWEVEEGVDAVSTATTSKFLGTDGLARGTYNNGTYIMGVTLPVRVTESDYAKLASNLTANDDYYFVDLAEEPTAYSTLTIDSNGSYSFSAMAASTLNTASTLSVGEQSLTAGYGDYQIDLVGIGTGADADVKGIAYKDANDTVAYKDAVIYGAIVDMTTTDNKTASLAMTALENLWYGTKVADVQIAWSIPEGQGLCRAHNSAEAGHYYWFEGTNGATINDVRVITSEGVITIDAVDLDSATDGNQTALAKYYDGDLSGFTYTFDASSVSLSGIPTELENAKVSIYTTSGHSSSYVVQNAEVTNGQATADLLATIVDGSKYTISITSDNYGPILKYYATPITADQKTQLQTLVDQAKATTGYDNNADLKQHVAEAEAMLDESTTATSYDAADLISELEEKIKATYPTLTFSASLTGTTLTLTGITIADITNGTYKVASGSGYKTTTYASGSLTDTTITLDSAPEAGTSLTVTISGDNIQDSTYTFTTE